MSYKLRTSVTLVTGESSGMFAVSHDIRTWVVGSMVLFAASGCSLLTGESDTDNLDARRNEAFTAATQKSSFAENLLSSAVSPRQNGMVTPEGPGTTATGREQLIRHARPQAPTTETNQPPAPIVPASASEPNNQTVIPKGPTPDKGTTQIRVIATIGTEIVVTDDEVWQMVRQRVPEYIRLKDAERNAKEKELFREELRKLIERELVMLELQSKLKKNNKTQLLDELKEEAARIASKQLKAYRENNAERALSEPEFEKMMRDQGLNYKSVTRQLERSAMKDMYLSNYFKEKLKPISLFDIKQYYDANPKEFTLEDRVKWLHLFVSYRYFPTTVEARQYVDALLAKARAGTDFVQIVRESGHGDSKLRDGAGIGEKRGEIRPVELESQLFTLTANQISEIIPAEHGFHVLKVLERDVAGVRPFDEKTQAFIRMKLNGLAQKAEYERLIEDLWRKTPVKLIHMP